MAAAPVYRHLDAKNRFLGLSLGQAFAVGAVVFLALSVLSPVAAAIAAAATYAVIRVGLRRRADGFVRHWTWWTARRVLAQGHLSAKARSHTPRFPYAPYVERDVGLRRPANGTAAR
jgi:hypothetical protein